MQEFPPIEDYFWMDSLTRFKVTLSALHSVKTNFALEAEPRALHAQPYNAEYGTANEIPEYSKVLGMHQTTCTCTTTQIICKTALVHSLSETQHVHIWDWYLFLKLSWNRVQSSKTWDRHVQQGSFHWPCFHEKAILKSKHSANDTCLEIKKLSNKDIIIMFPFVRDADKRWKTSRLCKTRKDPW